MSSATASPGYFDGNHYTSHTGGTPLSSSAGPSSPPILPTPASPWKSFFRLGSAAGRKLNRSKSALTLDTEYAASSAVNEDGSLNSTHPTHGFPASKSYSQSPSRAGPVRGGDSSLTMHTNGVSATLTPSSSVSFNTSLSNRYSSNSTGTLSSESGMGIAVGGQNRSISEYYSLNGASAGANGVANGHSALASPRGRRSRPHTQPETPANRSDEQRASVSLLPTPSSSVGRERKKSKTSKSDKYRALGVGQPSVLLTPVTSASVSPVPERSGGVTSPKTSKSGMSATATKFIRRVASAPNAKGFFTLSKSHRDRDRDRDQAHPHSPGARTPTSLKGFGFLSSSGNGGRTSPVPEVPPVPNHASGVGQKFSTSEQGTDSLDTSSSGSSSKRRKYLNSVQSSPPQSLGPNSRVPQLTHSQSVQHLHAPQPQLLSPPKGTRTTRALSAATGTAPFKSKGKEHERIGLLTTTPVPVGTGSDGQARAPFRRTYSSNSIKVRSVEVGPSSFQKVKLLGRGDVGKVYLVREKKTAKLYAMKGALLQAGVMCEIL